MADIAFLIGFILCIELFRRGQVARFLYLESFPTQLHRHATREQIPEHQRPMLADAESKLLTLGFVYSHAAEFSRFEGGVPCQQIELRFVHAKHPVMAHLAAPLIAEPHRVYILSFSTLLSDGTRLISSEVPGLFHMFSAKHIHLLSVADSSVEGHWEEFFNELKKHESSAIAASGLDFEAVNSALEAWFLHQVASRRMCVYEGRYYFRLWGAWIGASRLLAAMKKQQALRATKPEALGSPGLDSLPLDAEIASFQLLKRINEGRRLKAFGKGALMLVTAVLFFASFGLKLSFLSVSILLLVIFLHELGHLAAMKCFGYQDLRLLFLPFLGAVAIGRQKNTPAYQKVIVALAGPLPGLLLGLLMLSVGEVGGKTPSSEMAWMLVVVNFGNLIPLMPLDGGQVLHALLFSRFPAIEAAFTILGGVCLAALGFYSGETVLCFVGLFVLLAAKSQVRRSRLLHAFRKGVQNSAKLEEQELLRKVFQHLRAEGAGVNTTNRQQLAEHLFVNAGASFSGLRQTSLLLLLYVVSFLIFPFSLFFLELKIREANATSSTEERVRIDQDGREVFVFDEKREASEFRN